LNLPNPFQSSPENRFSPDEIEVRIWAFVVIAITMILFGIVIALLYSVTFVVQPIKSMAPIDQAYTKMLNDIVLLIVGGIGGIVGKRAVGGVAGTLAGIKQATNPTPPMMGMMGQPCYPAQGMQGSMGFSPIQSSGQPFGAMPNFTNPALDESWTPPPPPTTPPTLESDDDREHQAAARETAKAE
jgi:hypothetical protein